MFSAYENGVGACVHDVKVFQANAETGARNRDASQHLAAEQRSLTVRGNPTRRHSTEISAKSVDDLMHLASQNDYYEN